ncbi:MAG: DUF4347 domain-containing protein [Alphaproteobacteria bacterium]|jgi:hypothetical protein|nr:DUF4347 domain-containing protein [Alphaproteobacteria bacterium]
MAIDGTPQENWVLFWRARFSYYLTIDVVGIQDMVQKIQRITSHYVKIKSLYIAGHGTEKFIKIGHDILWEGNLKSAAPYLLQLRCDFAPGASVTLDACKTGRAVNLLRGLAQLWPGVSVVGYDENQFPGHPGHEGHARMCRHSSRLSSTSCLYHGPY